jgi:hypothetical protein
MMEQTPLLIMAMKGDEAVVKLLARSDAEVNSRDQCGQALLILCRTLFLLGQCNLKLQTALDTMCSTDHRCENVNLC